MQRFASTLDIGPETRILDVGGVAEYWQMLPRRPHVVLLNQPRAQAELSAAASWVAGDGRNLPFADQSFDFVFSNSVIEHVGDAADQQRFASEVARVGRGYWVQTPNRWFPIEQHLLTPAIHWLPKAWQRALVPRFTIWGIFSRVSRDRREFYLEHYLNQIRLLDAREVRQLFPDARVTRERFLGWTKSLVAVKLPDVSAWLPARRLPDSRTT